MEVFSSQAYKTYKLLAIDPGLNNIGVSVYLIRADTETIESISSFTLEVEKLRDTSGLDDLDTLQRFQKLETIKNKFIKIFEDYNPDVIVSESPFFNPSRPNAFEALVQVLLVIYQAIVTFNKNLSLLRQSPQEVKKAVGVAGKLGKDVVKEAVKKVKEIMDHFEDGIDDLSEHAIDSLAVGYTELKLRRKLRNDHEKTKGV